MATTTRYSWPTPEDSDIPDVPDDMGKLATAVENTVGSLDDRLTTLTGMSASIFQYTTIYRGSSNRLDVPNAQWYAISFDIAQTNLPADNPGWVLSNPTQIRCMQTGLYRMTGFAGFVQNGTGTRAIALRVNGQPSYPAIQNCPAPSDMPSYLSVYIEAKVNKDDVIELCLRQTSGGTLKMDAIFPRFSMQRLI